MKKRITLKSTVSLLLSVVLIASMWLTVPFLTSAEGTVITQVKFDYGDSATIGDSLTNDVTDNTVALPSTTLSGQKSDYATRYPVANLIGWTDGVSYFKAEDGAIGVDKIASSAVADGVATLTAVYGGFSVDFNDLTGLSSFGSANLGTGAASVANGALIISENQGEKNRVVTLPVKNGDSYATNYYNLGKSYKITFKYITENAGLTINAAFGTVTSSGSLNWYGGQFVAENKGIATTVATGGEWKEVSATVTAPNTYKNATTSEGDVYARSIGLMIQTKAKDDVIHIDDVTVEPVITAVFNYPDGTVENLEFDDSGNLTLPADKDVNSANLVWVNGGNKYTPGQTVNKSDLAFNGVTYNFTSIYGEAVINYQNVPAEFKFYQDGAYNYGTGAASVTGGVVTVSNRPNYGQALLFKRDLSNKDTFVYYTPSQDYMVSLTYNSTVAVKLYAAFGMATDWNCGGKCDKPLELGTVNASEGWTTVSFFVTAPKAYGNYSKRVGIGFEGDIGTNGFSYKDIKIEPIDEIRTAHFTFDSVEEAKNYDLKFFGDELTLPEISDCANTAYWKNGSSKFTAGTTVPVSNLTANADGSYTFKAVYGNAVVDYTNRDANDQPYGTGAAKFIVDENGRYLRIKTNTPDVRQIPLENGTGTAKGKYVKFTPGESYELAVTLKVAEFTSSSALKFGVGFSPYENNDTWVHHNNGNWNGDDKPTNGYKCTLGDLAPAIDSNTTKGEVVTLKGTFTAPESTDIHGTNYLLTVYFGGVELNGATLQITQIAVTNLDNTAHFTYNADSIDGYKNYDKLFADDLTLPEISDSANTAYWKNGNSKFNAGTKVAVDQLTPDEDGTYTFKAIYGSAVIDYTNRTENTENNKPYDTGAASFQSDENGKSYLQIITNTADGRQIPLENGTGTARGKYVKFTPGQTYVLSVRLNVTKFVSSENLKLGVGYSPVFELYKEGQTQNNNKKSDSEIGTQFYDLKAYNTTTNGYVTFTGEFTAPTDVKGTNLALTFVFYGVQKDEAIFQVTQIAVAPVEDCVTLSLNYNNGINDVTNKVPSGTSYALPQPSRDGHEFAGWYTDAACQNTAANPFTVNENTTLYADWIPVSDKIGDVNNDGYIDIRDIVKVKSVVKGVTADEALTARADINKDGKVDGDDLSSLRQSILSGTDPEINLQKGVYVTGVSLKSFTYCNAVTNATLVPSASALIQTLGISASTDSTGLEILIGNTGRTETAEALKQITKGGIIYVIGDKLVIAAHDDASLEQAVAMVNRWVKYTEKNNKVLILNQGFKKKI